MGTYRIAMRTTQQMMDDRFGVPVSIGTISQLEQATTAAVAALVEEVRSYVHDQEVAHLNEYTWSQEANRRGYGWQ
jgi:transposase